jgi:hypothetical protein
MKKTIIILFLSFAYNINAQKLQGCDRYDDSVTLLARLNKFPVEEFSYNDINTKCNVSMKIRERLINLLNWDRPKHEIDTYVEKEFREIGYPKIVHEYSQKRAQGKDSIYHIVYDSFANVIKQKLKPKLLVRGNIILSVGYLCLDKAYFKLKQSLKDTLHYDRYAILMALARMGDTSAQELVLNDIHYNALTKSYNWERE